MCYNLRVTNTYELMVVYSPETNEDQQKTAFSSLEKQVTVRGGSVISHTFLGKRHFSYPIRKQFEGLYALWVVDLPVTAPALLENDLRVNEMVLRHLLTKTEIKVEQVEQVEQVKKKKTKKVTAKKKGK